MGYHVFPTDHFQVCSILASPSIYMGWGEVEGSLSSPTISNYTVDSWNTHCNYLYLLVPYIATTYIFLPSSEYVIDTSYKLQLQCCLLHQDDAGSYNKLQLLWYTFHHVTTTLLDPKTQIAPTLLSSVPSSNYVVDSHNITSSCFVIFFIKFQPRRWLLKKLRTPLATTLFSPPSSNCSMQSFGNGGVYIYI